MYWNEKIDLIKKQFPPNLFRDPSYEGREIVEKIVLKLHHSTLSGFRRSEDRAALIRNGSLWGIFTVKQFMKRPFHG